MTRSKRTVGLRRGRVAFVGAVAASAVMALGASSARAADVPFSVTFDDAALNLGGLGFDVLDPPNTATLTGTVDDTTGALAANPGDFDFPAFTGEPLPGFPVSVDFSALDPITGNVNLLTGEVSTAASTYQAAVSLPSLGATCNYAVDLAFSTAPGSPFNGDPFTVVPGNPTTVTNGVIQDSWGVGEVGPGTGLLCGTAAGLLDPILGQAGGVAIGNGVDITPETPPAVAPSAIVPKKLSKRQRCIRTAKKINDKQKRKNALKKCRKKKRKK